jgi:hypothetical protein
MRIAISWTKGYLDAGGAYDAYYLVEIWPLIGRAASGCNAVQLVRDGLVSIGSPISTESKSSSSSACAVSLVRA